MHFKPAIVLIDPPMSGSENMSIDERLLASAKPDWPIILRIYAWNFPTLSLGHFQSEQEVPHGLFGGRFATVKRKTGGGAILHDHEITYSIVIPADEQMGEKGPSERLYRSVHSSIRDGLRDLGLDAEFHENGTCTRDLSCDRDSFLCFLRRSPVDLIVNQHKILGSAQRRSRTGLLQHGSFLIRRSEVLDCLSGVHDLFASQMQPDSSGWTSSTVPAWSVEEWQAWTCGKIQRGIEDVTKCSWVDSELKDSSHILRFVEVGSGSTPAATDD